MFAAVFRIETTTTTDIERRYSAQSQLEKKWVAAVAVVVVETVGNSMGAGASRTGTWENEVVKGRGLSTVAGNGDPELERQLAEERRRQKLREKHNLVRL